MAGEGPQFRIILPTISRLTWLMGKAFAAVCTFRVVYSTVRVLQQGGAKFPLRTPLFAGIRRPNYRRHGQSYVQGLTLLGGEPFLNTQVCLRLVRRVRQEFGHDKDIWSWTGYTWDELMQESYDKLELLSELDILVDGRFLEAKKDLTLQFRGSSNQRIIDVPKSLAANQVVIWDKLLR